VTGAGSRWINTNDLYVGFTGPAVTSTVCHGSLYIAGNIASLNTRGDRGAGPVKPT